jgi:hypothetical protein
MKYLQPLGQKGWSGVMEVVAQLDILRSIYE